MKVAVIAFHKNIDKIYEKWWVEKCVLSLENQTYKDFDFFEVSYGDEPLSLSAYLDRTLDFSKIYFYHKPLENHVYAMNFVLDQLFRMGYDVAVNTNLDDSYPANRIQYQLEFIEKNDVDLVSSNFVHIV